MAVITALFILIGGVLGGGTGVLIAFLMAVGMNFFSYWNSDKMVLSMVGAHQIDGSNYL
jgi:heat shock protein HtpX